MSAVAMDRAKEILAMIERETRRGERINTLAREGLTSIRTGNPLPSCLREGDGTPERRVAYDTASRTCATCRWWSVEPTRYGLTTRACKMVEMDGPKAIVEQEVGAELVWLETEPDFGCNQWGAA